MSIRIRGIIGLLSIFGRLTYTIGCTIKKVLNGVCKGTYFLRGRAIGSTRVYATTYGNGTYISSINKGLKEDSLRDRLSDLGGIEGKLTRNFSSFGKISCSILKRTYGRISTLSFRFRLFLWKVYKTSIGFGLLNDTFASRRIVLLLSRISGYIIGLITYGSRETTNGGATGKGCNGLAYTTTSVGCRETYELLGERSYASYDYRKLLGSKGALYAYALYNFLGYASFGNDCT